MLRAIQGIYCDGKIQLTEVPRGVRDDTPVIVTFLTSGKNSCGSGNRLSTASCKIKAVFEAVYGHSFVIVNDNDHCHDV